MYASSLLDKGGFRYNLEAYISLEDLAAIRNALMNLETRHYNVDLSHLKTRVSGEFDTIYLGNINFKGNIGSLAEKVQARTFDILAINGVVIAQVNKNHVIRFIKKQCRRCYDMNKFFIPFQFLDRNTIQRGIIF